MLIDIPVTEMNSVSLDRRHTATAAPIYQHCLRNILFSFVYFLKSHRTGSISRL